MVFSSYKKELSTDIHATTWMKLGNMLRKPDTKGHVLYDSIYMKYSEQINPYIESKMVVPRS